MIGPGSDKNLMKYSKGQIHYFHYTKGEFSPFSTCYEIWAGFFEEKIAKGFLLLIYFWEHLVDLSNDIQSKAKKHKLDQMRWKAEKEENISRIRTFVLIHMNVFCVLNCQIPPLWVMDYESNTFSQRPWPKKPLKYIDR